MMLEADALTDFSLCGWRFRSAIPVAALPSWADEDRTPVGIELVMGHVPERECSDLVGVFVNDDRSATVVAADAGRFTVRDGRTVIADIRKDALPGAVETIVLGPVLGTLCYQRGILPLHSNTIAINGRAVALSGRSGAGKSTLAAVLLRRGHRLIADDVLPIVKTDHGTLALPGNQHLRLWGKTLDWFGTSSDGLRRAADGDREKYFLPPTMDKTSSAWPLAALVWLESGLSEVQLLRAQTGMLRARTIVKATYRQHLAKDYAGMGQTATTDLSLPGVDVFEFLRPRDLDLLEEQADMIEALTETSN